MAQNPLEVSMEVPITGIKLLGSASTRSLCLPHKGSPNRVTKVLLSLDGEAGQKKFSFYKMGCDLELHICRTDRHKSIVQ